MTFLSWRNDYEVGVPLNDAEHHRLFDLVNEFHETYLSGEASKGIPKILNQLVAYAQAHFEHEETLMSENNYPMLEQHRNQHDDLVTSAFAINERLAADPAAASAETLKFAHQWLQNHILHDDMDIADFLKRKANQARKLELNEAPTESEDCTRSDKSDTEKRE